MRICSFLPSGTEIVYLMGLGDSLQGVSHECDYPKEAISKPKVVRSKFDPYYLTSREIDALVSQMLVRGESIYEIDIEILKKAEPDLIITQKLCEVCAVSLDDVEDAINHLDISPLVVSLDPHSIDEMLQDIERIGRAVGMPDCAKELVADLAKRVFGVKSRTSQYAYRPRVACIEWFDPLMVAGHWIPGMVSMSGGIDVMARPGDLSRKIEMEELVRGRPEILILMPCGMDLSRAIELSAALSDLAQWETLPAVQDGRVYVTDASGLFSRSGPRLVDGMELMTKMIHPGTPHEPLPAGAGVLLD